MTREFEYWTPQPIFKGETVFCLASGPSLTQEIADQLRDRKTIAVNSTGPTLAPWASVLYFTDSSWYETHSEIVKNWAGLVVTMSNTAKRELPDKVLRVRGVGDPTSGMPGSFPPIGSDAIRQGRSSGHTAVSLAIALGASRVALVGYDMRVIDGREHHHQEYISPRDLEQYARDFVPTFDGWNADAFNIGVQILNATPGSAITEFPFVNLDEVLSCDAS